jgi:hypothetical protein
MQKRKLGNLEVSALGFGLSTPPIPTTGEPLEARRLLWEDSGLNYERQASRQSVGEESEQRD